MPSATPSAGASSMSMRSVDRGPGHNCRPQKACRGRVQPAPSSLPCATTSKWSRGSPYPATVPKKLAVASEVATTALLRSSGLPIPEVYGYSASTDNTAKTKFKFMQFVQGTSLSDMWFNLEGKDMVCILRQVSELGSKVMSIRFPAGGSLHFSKVSETVAESPDIPLKGERFCVGSVTRPLLWYGRKAQLDFGRLPCTPLSAFFYYSQK
jgi:hypothetical protein